MASQATAVRKNQQIARPLKVLIPLIQGELQQGNDGGAAVIRSIAFVAALVLLWFVMTAAVTLYHAPRFYLEQTNGK